MKIALDITPFTRIVWKNRKIKELWEPRLSRISRLQNLAEYETVKLGYRKGATIHLTFDNAFDLFSKVTEDNLYFLPIAKSGYYSGFSHCHRPVKPGDPYFIYGVLARDREVARRFKEASSSPDRVHLDVGKALGYPSCCTEAFNKRWRAGKIDPMWEAALETIDRESVVSEPMEDEGTKHTVVCKPSPEANQMLRYFGARITTHLPCSFNCNKTLEVAEDWKETMKEIDPIAYEWLVKLLKKPLVWDAYYGILQVSNELLVGVTTTGFTQDRFIIKTK